MAKIAVLLQELEHGKYHHEEYRAHVEFRTASETIGSNTTLTNQVNDLDRLVLLTEQHILCIEQKKLENHVNLKNIQGIELEKNELLIHRAKKSDLKILMPDVQSAEKFNASIFEVLKSIE